MCGECKGVPFSSLAVVLQGGPATSARPTGTLKVCGAGTTIKAATPGHPTPVVEPRLRSISAAYRAGAIRVRAGHPGPCAVRAGAWLGAGRVAARLGTSAEGLPRAR